MQPIHLQSTHLIKGAKTIADMDVPVSLTAAVRVPKLNVPFFVRARNNKVQRSKQRALLTQQFDPFFLQRRAGL